MNGRLSRSLLELAVFAAVLLADAQGLVPLTLTVALVPAVWLLQRLSHEPWSTLGLRRPEHWARSILMGVVAGLAVELFAMFVTTPLLGKVVGGAPDYSGFDFIRGNLGYLALVLVLNWVLAAFGEEVCFRGFLMHRLARAFGNSTAAWISSLVIASAVFGWMHSEQGLAGALQEGLSGFLLGVLFLWTGRNLTVPIVAHGVSNTLAFVLIYLGRYSG